MSSSSRATRLVRAAMLLVCTGIVVGVGLYLAVWRVWHNVATADALDHIADKTIIRSQLTQLGGVLNLSQLNRGDWKVACLVGQLGEYASVAAFAQDNRIVLPGTVSKNWISPKFRPFVVFVTSDNRLEVFAAHEIWCLVATHEVTCASPHAPSVKLPTHKARTECTPRVRAQSAE